MANRRGAAHYKDWSFVLMIAAMVYYIKLHLRKRKSAQAVMVPAKSWARPELLNDGFPAFSDKAISTLQSIISKDDIIILTTSHKDRYSLEEWKQIFKNRGLNIGNIQSLEVNTENLNRKDEISKRVFSSNLNDSFVIIDDDKSLNDLPKHLKSHLVLTNSMVGLTQEHVAEIRKIRQSSYI